MRPILSTSTSTAPERKNRLKLRVSAEPSGSSPTLSVIRCHCDLGYTKRQLSSPRVTTRHFPSSLRHLDGKDSRFLGSNVCLYSPINIVSIAMRYGSSASRDLRRSYHHAARGELTITTTETSTYFIRSIPLSPTTFTLYTTSSHQQPHRCG